MRQLVIQRLQERASHEFGDGVLGTLLADLVVRIHLRPLGRVVDEHVAHFGQIVMLQGAHRHDVRKVGELVDLDKLVDELLTAEFINLGDDGDQRNAPRERAVLSLGGKVGTQTGQNTLVTRANFLISRQQERHHVHVRQRLLHHIVQTLAEQRARTVNARRIHEYKLCIISGQNAANGFTRGLRSGGGDGNLLADQSINQRRLANVRSADHSHKARAVRHFLPH